MKTYPHVITHVGLTVPDIEAAVQWYTDILGFVVLMPPVRSVAGEGHFGNIGSDIYTSKFKANKMAMLTSGNSVGLELFEFENPSTKEFTLEYAPWEPGYFHLAVINPDVEGLVQRIEENGGKRISKKWAIFPDQYPYELCYVQDPWGNVIEIFSHSNDSIMAPR